MEGLSSVHRVLTRRVDAVVETVTAAGFREYPKILFLYAEWKQKENQGTLSSS